MGTFLLIDRFALNPTIINLAFASDNAISFSKWHRTPTLIACYPTYE